MRINTYVREDLEKKARSVLLSAYERAGYPDPATFVAAVMAENASAYVPTRESWTPQAMNGYLFGQAKYLAEDEYYDLAEWLAANRP